MKKLALFIISGRLAGATCCAGFAALAIFFPPIFILANASVVLHTLCKGLRPSLLMVGMASLLLSLWYVFLQQPADTSLPFLPAYRNTLLTVFLLWLPFLLLAWVLQTTRSLTLIFQITAVAGMLGILLLAWIINSPIVFWDALFSAIIQDEVMQSIQADTEMQQNYQSILAFVSAALVAGTVLFVLVSMLLGRWWQSLLYNLGGFKKEFLSLQLGRFYAATATALVLVAWTFQSSLAKEFCIVLMVPLLFQGIATVHFFLSGTTHANRWLSVFYVALALAFISYPAVLLLLVLLAIAEALFDLRAKALTV